MAKIQIKESDIRNYVRALIREARKTSIETTTELEKMKNGQNFDLDNLEKSKAGRDAAKDFFAAKGIKKPRKPIEKASKGLYSPHRIINFETGDLENAQELADFSERLRSIGYNQHRQRIGQNYRNRRDDKLDNTQSRRDLILSLGLGNDAELEDGVSDKYTNKWLRMSDDEKAAARQAIRDREKQQRQEEYDQIRQSLKSVQPFHVPNAEELRQRLSDLRDKKAALGPHNNLNDRKWREYDYLIKDTQNILRTYYKSSKVDKDSSDPMADEIVNNALSDDLSTEEEFKDFNFNQFEKNKKAEKEDNELLDDDDWGRSKKKRNFDDNRDFFDLDDEYGW